MVFQGAQSKVQGRDWQVGMEREGSSIFLGEYHVEGVVEGGVKEQMIPRPRTRSLDFTDNRDY